jgi:VWFA-related protein
MTHRLVVAAAILAATSAAPSSQQAQPPTFRSSRDVLTIEAAIRDGRGQPVVDLRPDDFTVTIDGEPRRVLDAQLFGHDAGRLTAPVTPIPRFTRAADATPGRVIIIAVDRDTIRAGTEKPVLDTASAMLASLSPADAVGTIGLPVGGSDPTRDHAAAAAAVRTLTGTRPLTPWNYMVTWDEAIAFDIRDRSTIERVVERECQQKDTQCPDELRRQTQEMLVFGRTQTRSTLQRLSNLIGALSVLRAPKHLVLLSGGMPFDVELLPHYEDIARKAAQSRVAISIVHLDQPRSEASDKLNGLSVFGGRDYATGIGTIAAMTGGVFLGAVGKAQGTFDRIVGDINYFYQLGVESRPSDGDGRNRRVQVKVNRANVSVRAPSLTAAAPRPTSEDEALTRALSQPTDVAALPLEVATYMTHSPRPDSVRLIVSAAMVEAPGVVPVEWGYVVLDGEKMVGGTRDEIAQVNRGPWSATTSIDIPAGRYRIRIAVLANDGRVGSVDLPLTAALRTAAGVHASDLLLGTALGGRLAPEPRLKQTDDGVAMLELSSLEPLAAIGGGIELIKAGTTQAQLRQPLELRARENDSTVVVAQARLDLSALSPGTYMASAVLEKEGKSFARISRLVDVLASESTTAAVSTPPLPATPASKPAAPRDPELADILARVGAYAGGYGEQAAFVAVEHYEQAYRDAPLGEPSVRKLVAELVLVRSSGATGWVAFRDVSSVDGKPIRDRQDRLLSLFKSGTPDVAEARRIADESSRFNIGPIRRNFNEPTAALLFLRSSNQARFEFSRRGVETVGRIKAVTINFGEKTRPTLVRTEDGRDVPLEGTVLVDPETGTILRTRLILRGFAGVRSSSTVDVTFARNDRLGLWLPSVMTERHEGISRIASPRGGAVVAPVLVIATARYDDFKRFETSATVTVK